jgi:hypothetical protein
VTAQVSLVPDKQKINGRSTLHLHETDMAINLADTGDIPPAGLKAAHYRQQATLTQASHSKPQISGPSVPACDTTCVPARSADKHG